MATTSSLPPDPLEAIWRLPSPERDPFVATLSPAWQETARALLRGPDPQGALLRALRLPPDARHLPLSLPLCRLLHHGDYPASLHRAQLPEADSILEQAAPSPTTLESRRAEWLRELREHAAKDGPANAIARLRMREYLRLALREVDGAPVEEVCAELSELAAACVQIGLESLRPDTDAPPLSESVVVFGMGKLAGHELNFLSDIDLLFVHRDDLIPESDENRAHRARNKLHTALRQLVRWLEGEGSFRPIFRVDLRLRPFGSRGPLSLSLRGTEAYYERHGRAWERQVWLRARPIAGDIETGERLLSYLDPFVYRRSVSPAIFSEVSQMMQRARQESRNDLGASAVDIKHDTGGIREVEFFVQALQLLNGGRNPAVRSTSTLRGLDRLAAAGLLSDREHAELGDAYRWYRRVEHRVQLGAGQQTHSIPGDPEERQLLAARLRATHDFFSATPSPTGSAEESKATLRTDFEATLDGHRNRVRAIGQTMLPEESSERLSPEEVLRRRANDIVSDPGASDHARLNALRQLDLRDPEEVNALLTHLHSRRHGAFSDPGESGEGARRLLSACLDSAEPEDALRRLVDFAHARPAHYAVWRFLSASKRKELVRRVADLFGASEPLSRGLIGFPNSHGIAEDGCISLLMSTDLRGLPESKDVSALLEELESSFPGSELDDTLLRLKQRELVRIGLHDLGSRPDPLEVGRSLSQLADVILRRILFDLAATADTPPLTLAVFALGKYGMEAMDYGSDLDLLFVFDPADEEPSQRQAAQVAATRIARKLIARLQAGRRSSRLFEVDMRLRPSGNQGLLVSSLDAFRRYHSVRLPLWERLAVLRLRAVAEIEIGSPSNSPVSTPPISKPPISKPPISAPSIRSRLAPSPGRLSHEVLEGILPHSLNASDPSSNETISARLRALKERIETEVARESHDSFDVKSGYGGCLELELLVSALLLKSGPAPGHKRLPTTIPEGLQQLAEQEQISPDDADRLGSVYRFLRLLLNRLRMGRGGSSFDSPDRLSVNSPRLTALARRMGLAGREALLATYGDHRTLVREAFDRYIL